jgi:hypothetical protein
VIEKKIEKGNYRETAEREKQADRQTEKFERE